MVLFCLAGESEYDYDAHASNVMCPVIMGTTNSTHIRTVGVCVLVPKTCKNPYLRLGPCAVVGQCVHI